jgi:hypothetical protein
MRWIVVLVVVVILLIILLWVKSGGEGGQTTSILQPPLIIGSHEKDGTIQVKWKPVIEADRYTMYFSNVSGFEKEKARTIHDIQGESISISKVPPGTYYFRFASQKGKVESKWSEEKRLEVSSSEPPSPPVDFQKQYNEDGSVKLSWTSDSTADGYHLYVKAEGTPVGDETDTLVIKIDDPFQTEHVLTDLSPNSVWQVSVASFTKHGGRGKISPALHI